MEVVNQEKPISVGEWVLTIFIAAIPLVGFVMLFVWGFGGNAPETKANWAKATLLWILIGVVLYGLLFMAFGVALLSTGEFT